MTSLELSQEWGPTTRTRSKAANAAPRTDTFRSCVKTARRDDPKDTTLAGPQVPASVTRWANKIAIGYLRIVVLPSVIIAILLLCDVGHGSFGMLGQGFAKFFVFAVILPVGSFVALEKFGPTYKTVIRR